MPTSSRSIQRADEQLAELTMLCGLDDALAKQATATSNRIRGLLTEIHPALGRVLGPGLDHGQCSIFCGDRADPRSPPPCQPAQDRKPAQEACTAEG